MLTELRTAFRRLLHQPLFASVAVVTLAIGIGAAAAVFTVIRAVLFEPLSYPEPESLVTVWHTDPENEKWRHAHVAYLFYREQNRVFEDMGLYVADRANLASGELPERLPAIRVTPSVLAVLGVPPSLGRMFSEEEGEPGADPVVILGYSLWRSRFGGDPSVLGRTLWIDGTGRKVVGVMPPEFDVASIEADLLLPMEVDRAEPETGVWNYIAIARLREGAGLEDAENEMRALTARVYEAFPDPAAARAVFETMKISSAVVPLHEEVVGTVAGVLWILFGCVAVVLAIAVANVANLFLVRSEVRRQEAALRTALGATRPAVVRAAMAECLVIATAAGAAGLLLAAFGVRLFLDLAPAGIPRLGEVAVDTSTVIFVVVAALSSALISGVAPGLRAGGEPSEMLREGGRNATVGRSRQRIRNALVVLQLAMALTLMVMSGLLVRSFMALRAVDIGCEPDGVVVARLPISESDYPGPQDALAFYEQIVERIDGLAGVERASVTTGVPVADNGVLLGHSFEDFPLGEGVNAPNYLAHLMLPGAFEVLSIPVIAGRALNRQDMGGRARMVVISESLARRFWDRPSDAVGRRVMPGRPADGGYWYTVVGVVGDVPYGGLADGVTDALYYPFWSLRVGARDVVYTSQLDLVIASELPVRAVMGPVVDQVRELDPRLPVSDVRSLEELTAAAAARTRFTMMLLLVSACVAVTLGAVGLYGVISYVVSRRVREIGVRMALGADPGAVSWLVLRQALLLAVVGIGLGVSGALFAGRVAAAQLYGVGPADPLTFGVVSVLLVGVALMASYIPARRAASLHPLDALRTD